MSTCASPSLGGSRQPSVPFSKLAHRVRLGERERGHARRRRRRRRCPRSGRRSSRRRAAAARGPCSARPPGRRRPSGARAATRPARARRRAGGGGASRARAATSVSSRPVRTPRPSRSCSASSSASSARCSAAVWARGAAPAAGAQARASEEGCRQGSLEHAAPSQVPRRLSGRESLAEWELDDLGRRSVDVHGVARGGLAPDEGERDRAVRGGDAGRADPADLALAERDRLAVLGRVG